MTAPVIVRRRLTINFDRSVRGGKPQVMEVVVIPLTNPSAPNNDATLVGGSQSQDVLLGNTVNPVYFDLVPSGSPDLTASLPYRIGWREKYMGTQFTKDFVMPDADIDFDDLENLGNLLGGETYVQWSDRSKPLGVAALDEDGNVIDAAGNPLTGDGAASTVQVHLDTEVVARQQADVALQQSFTASQASQTTAITNATNASIQAATGVVENHLLVEQAARQDADTAITAATSTAVAEITGDITAINGSITAIQTTLPNKADLVGGKVPSAQLPALAVGNAVTVANQAAMLALTPAQVQPGDLAVRPDGTWMLNGTDPSVLSNWVKLTDAGTVASVNGQTGAVVLNAANVNARPAAAPIPLADITGLQSALDAKTDKTSSIALTNRVAAIENSTTIVKTVGGVVPHGQHGDDVVFLSEANHLVNKDGVPVSPTGSVTVAIADVTGLQTALNGKLSILSPAVTNARTPTPHAASHQAGGSDAITLAPADITGLAAIISNNGLSSSSNHGNRINALEAGGGGGGSGSPAKSAWFDNPSIIGPTTALSAFNPVVQKSPFGKTGSAYYYNPAGAAEGESVYPYITPGGHLKFVQRNEANPPDPALATQASLDTVSSQLANKADQASLTSTNATVATKADASALAAKANQSALDTTNATVTAVQNAVATKAEQTAVAALQTGKANATGTAPSLAATNTQVGLKANQTALDTTAADVVALQAGKADKVSGLVPVAQIPALPISQVTNLQTTLDAKADLAGGTTVFLSQIPALPTTKITGLDTQLGLKADLVGGLVPTAQLPALAYTSTVVVANQTAMLTLTTAQVQPGDVCVITATTAQGSYILTAADPSVLANWTKLIAPSGTVATVNGQSGTVVLAPGDIGAAVAGTNAIPQTYVSGLATSLAGKVDTATHTADLALKADATAVTGAQVSQNKQQVAAVATTNVVTNNLQPVDGSNPPSGSVVLLAGQTNPVDRGVYTVNGSGAWTRSADMPNAQYLLKGTIVTCSGGSTHKDTFWQLTTASGAVGTVSQTWAKVMTAGVAPVYTGSLGVEKTGNDFHAKVEAGLGILATSAGLKLDPNYAVRKYAVYIPAGVNPANITHGLGTPDVTASFRGGTSGEAVLVGWRVVDANNISVEFDAAPTSSTQWRVTICG